MKKYVIFVVFFVTWQFVTAQVIIENSHNFPVEIRTNNGKFQMSPNGRYKTTLLNCNAKNTYHLNWHGGKKSFTEKVAETLIIDVNREPASPAVSESNVVARSPDRRPTNTGQGELRVIKNSSGRRCQVISSEHGLEGLSLAPGQESDSVMISQGLIHLSLLVDLDADSVTTGRRYMQQVFTQIIAQDQKAVEITDNHLYVAFAGREKVVFVFHNTTPYDVVGVGGNVLGHVIAKGQSSRRRLEANDGFMNATWQYIDKNGIIRQAISIYVLAEKRMRVEIREIR
jgi:hypothetical protein